MPSEPVHDKSDKSDRKLDNACAWKHADGRDVMGMATHGRTW